MTPMVKRLLWLLLVTGWLMLLYCFAKAQDTSYVTVESIGHTDSSYSLDSYRVYNKQGQHFIGDNVFRIANAGSPVFSLRDKSYDGSTDYDTASFRPEFDKDVFSVIAKVTPSRSLDDYLPLWTNKSGNVGYGVRFMADNRLQVGISDGSSNTQALLSNDSVKVGVETYIAVTFDGSFIRFYFDGVLDVALPYPLANPLHAESPPHPFYIGSYGRETTTEWFEGSMKELQVYNVCLQESQLDVYPEPLDFYLGIGDEIDNGYDVYFYVLNGVKTYVQGRIVQYREFSQLKEIPNNHKTRR